NLIHLDLSNNSINFLANTLISLTKLQVLTMDHNKLTNIDFRRLPEDLTDLSLRHNFITTIHFVPPSARNLKRIDLTGNLLDFLSGSSSLNKLPSNLKQADLTNNRIAFIQEGALSHMEKLALLDLK
ncbi:leucine Rich repeat-containing domain protein, partial [Oesophagostomum dentatum]